LSRENEAKSNAERRASKIGTGLLNALLSEGRVAESLCCLPKCWLCERLEPVEKIPPGLFLVVSAEMLVLLPFPVVLQDYTLVTLDP
jgi:hypothetical protein